MYVCLHSSKRFYKIWGKPNFSFSKTWRWSLQNQGELCAVYCYSDCVCLEFWIFCGYRKTTALNTWSKTWSNTNLLSVSSFLHQLLDDLYDFHWDLLFWLLWLVLKFHLVHNILHINRDCRSSSVECFQTIQIPYDPQHHSWSRQHIVILGACGLTGKLCFKRREKCLIKPNTFDLFNYF